MYEYPVEIITNIFKNIPIKELIKFRIVSKSFKTIIDNINSKRNLRVILCIRDPHEKNIRSKFTMSESEIYLDYYHSSDYNYILPLWLSQIPSDTLEINIYNYPYPSYLELELIKVAKLLKNFKTYIGLTPPLLRLLLSEMSKYNLTTIIAADSPFGSRDYEIWSDDTICNIRKLDLRYSLKPLITDNCTNPFPKLKVLNLGTNVCNRKLYPLLSKPCFDRIIMLFLDTSTDDNMVNIIISKIPDSKIIQFSDEIGYCTIVKKYKNIQIILRYNEPCKICDQYEQWDENGKLLEAQDHRY